MFSRNYNNHGSSGAYVTRSEHEDKQAQNDTRRAKIVNALACIFVCVVGKNPKTPILSPMADDDAITLSGIGGLGSLVYICGTLVRCFRDLDLLVDKYCKLSTANC